ncbi:hypothetical protein F5887DRAFT_1075731 [Amanita rubescens]|nr:hypothetical protein F5887DRAFT_1075731 [Amanita rubescens]
MSPIQILRLQEGSLDPTTRQVLLWDYFLEPLQINPRVKRSEGAFRALCDKRPTDKALQIANMANIYKYAKAVICMPGGVSAVQSVKTMTGWMDRAWTLQEAVLNETTWMYISWPDKDPPQPTPLKIAPPFSPAPNLPLPNLPRPLLKLNKWIVEGQKYLVKLSHLVWMMKGSSHLGAAYQIESNVPVACLEGSRKTRTTADFPPTTKKTVLTATLGLLKHRNASGGLPSDIWVAMLMRVSTRPVDVVYSVMGFFDIQLDPYDEDRDAQDVFNEFARKAATLGSHGMAWLAAGDKVPRDPSSFLIPSLPGYDDSKRPPAKHYSGLPYHGCSEDDKRFLLKGSEGAPWYYLRASTTEWALSSDLLNDVYKTKWSYYIKFDTDSQPHILCAHALKNTEIRLPPRRPNAGNGGMIYRRVKEGDISDPFRDIDYDVVILVASSDREYFYALKLRWTKEGWVFGGDATVLLEPTPTMDKLPRRVHFTVGKGSQTVVRSWPCDHGGSQTSTESLPMSYGVILLKNHGIANTSKLTKVVWFGKKGDKPKPESWREFKIQFKTQPGGNDMQSLWLVSSTSETPSDEFAEDSMSKVIELPVKLAHFFYNATTTHDAVTEKSYFVAVRFAVHMIYLKAAVNEEQKNPQRTKIAIAPYTDKVSDQ